MAISTPHLSRVWHPEDVGVSTTHPAHDAVNRPAHRAGDLHHDAEAYGPDSSLPCATKATNRMITYMHYIDYRYDTPT